MTHARSISLILALAACVLPQHALAFFSDDAGAGAAMTAGTLSFSVIPDTLSSGISRAGHPELQFGVSLDAESLPPRYRVRVLSDGCAPLFFENLYIVVSGPASYSGRLAALDITGTDMAGSWSMTFAAGADLSAKKNQACKMKLVVEGWQQGFSAPDAGGFSHREERPLTLAATEDIGRQPTASIVLNEIYPREESGTTAPLDREWVELYNGTDSPVDVSGWILSEVQGGSPVEHAIASTCPSSSKVGHAKPYGTTSTVIQPGGLIVIEFCASDRLNNDGDAVRLYDASHALTDAYTYSGKKAAGKSYARIPDGSDWVDPEPTPGEPNTATAEDLRASGLDEEKVQELLALLGARTDERAEILRQDFSMQAELTEETASEALTPEAGTDTDEEADGETPEITEEEKMAEIFAGDDPGEQAHSVEEVTPDDGVPVGNPETSTEDNPASLGNIPVKEETVPVLSEEL